MPQDSISRQNFVVGAGAATLAACSSSAGGVGPPATTLWDLVVVGAGISGIGAAKTAQSYGAKVLVLEAQNHVGGRVFTDTSTFSEIGFDLGAQFFQQCIAGNELYTIAKAEGLTLLPSAGQTPPAGLGSALMAGTNLASPSQAGDFVTTTLAIKDAMFSEGLLIAGGAADVSIQSQIAGLSSLMWYQTAVAQSVIEFVGATDRSDLDIYNFMNLSFAPFVTAGDDYVVRTGCGTFVASLAKGLNITLNAPVTSVTLAPGGVTVKTANGQTYLAKAVVVTASMGVLASGGITFSPALPASYTAAFAGLPMSNVYKALLGLRGTPLSVPDPAIGTNFSVVLPLANTDAAAIFPNFWNTNTVEFIASGALALQLENAGPSGAAQILMAQLQSHFQTATWDGRITASSWTANPYTKGAYSAALPGQVPARTLLQAPISNQLWFAGEAVNSTGSRGLMQGAYRSGAAAASAAMHTLGFAVRSGER